MSHLQAYKFRIYPTDGQIMCLRRITGCCRLVYNLALEQRQLAWVRGVSLGYVTQANELPMLKHEFPFLKEVPSHSLQYALRNLDTAFQRFFEGHAAYPTFKKRGAGTSFTLPDPAQIRVDWHRHELILPKFGKTKRDNGPLKLLAHRAVKGKIRSVTVSEHGGIWFASILTQRNVKHPHARRIVDDRQIIGLDRGVALAVVGDTGFCANVEGQNSGGKKRVRRLQQSLARKKKGSNNRFKARAKLALCKAKEARRRSDQVHKITSTLIKNHDVFVLEDLKVRNMSRSAKGSINDPGTNVKAKSCLNRAILDKGWGELRRQLHYKALWAGKQVLEVSPVNTSRTCPDCGHVSAENRPSQAVFACKACGFHGHADRIAAFNIKQRGLAKLGLPPTLLPKDVRYQPVESSRISTSMKQESNPAKIALLRAAE